MSFPPCSLLRTPALRPGKDEGAAGASSPSPRPSPGWRGSCSVRVRGQPLADLRPEAVDGAPPGHQPDVPGRDNQLLLLLARNVIAERQCGRQRRDVIALGGDQQARPVDVFQVDRPPSNDQLAASKLV